MAKKKTNRAAGDAFQVRIAEIFVEAGYMVHMAKPSKKRYYQGGRAVFRTVQEDIFGIWDMIALRGDKPPIFIQTTTSGVSARKKKMAAKGALLPTEIDSLLVAEDRRKSAEPGALRFWIQDGRDGDYFEEVDWQTLEVFAK